MPESPTLLLGAQLPPRRPRDAAVACAAPSLGAAKAAVLAKILPKAAQNVALDDAGGRILTQDVHAASDYWPFSRAAMDGVAVRAHDVADASPDAPTRLPLLGAAYCGAAPQELTCGQAAIRIATGAAIPPGCDAVIPQELLVYDDGDILVQRPVRAGKHIFPAGEDMHAGERVLRAGTRCKAARSYTRWQPWRIAKTRLLPQPAKSLAVSVSFAVKCRPEITETVTARPSFLSPSF